VLPRHFPLRLILQT